MIVNLLGPIFPGYYCIGWLFTLLFIAGHTADWIRRGLSIHGFHHLIAMLLLSFTLPFFWPALVLSLLFEREKWRIRGR